MQDHKTSGKPEWRLMLLGSGLLTCGIAIGIGIGYGIFSAAKSAADPVEAFAADQESGLRKLDFTGMGEKLRADVLGQLKASDLLEEVNGEYYFSIDRAAQVLNARQMQEELGLSVSREDK